MHKVFITYHHENDQCYKDQLVAVGQQCNIFIDQSVDTGDISDDLGDEDIRIKIRDEYLYDSTVTIVLVGTETKKRKHVDWEIYDSMFDGKVNKKSGILVVNLPHVDNQNYIASHEGEKHLIYPDLKGCNVTRDRENLEQQHPYAPDRIIDNILKPKDLISITGWDRILDPRKLHFLINATFEDRVKCKYDLSRPLKRHNS